MQKPSWIQSLAIVLAAILVPIVGIFLMRRRKHHQVITIRAER